MWPGTGKYAEEAYLRNTTVRTAGAGDFFEGAENSILKEGREKRSLTWSGRKNHSGTAMRSTRRYCSELLELGSPDFEITKTETYTRISNDLYILIFNLNIINYIHKYICAYIYK